MADNSTILLSSNDKGDETRVDLGVLEVILGIAARKVDGVSEMRGTLKTGINTLFGRSNQGKGVSLSVEDDKLTLATLKDKKQSGAAFDNTVYESWDEWIGQIEKEVKAGETSISNIEFKKVLLEAVKKYVA